jgi:outer membrane protein OmpA-like peptidoglycan-associated protein
MRSLHRVVLMLIAAVALTGCASPPPAPITADLPLAQAVAAAADQAVEKMVSARGLARFLDRSTALYVAPVLDAHSRQQTATTVRVRELVAVHLKGQHRGLELVPFTAAAAALSEVRLDTTLTATTLPDGRRASDRLLLQVRLVSLRDGRTLARSDATVLDPALDATPIAFFRDSPFTLVPSPASSATATTSDTTTLSERERTVSIAQLDEAGASFSAGRYDRALALYRSAATLPGADTMQALVGAYLSSVRTGQEADARSAFARIVTLGLKTRAMGVKLLFAPGTTEFWSDPAISKPYPDWLREIARQAGEASSCLQVVGHSSRTGAEDYNLALSARRADAIRQQLETANPALARRVETTGVGWRENLVGLGSDDVKDAVDRRVEFKVVDCR